jgi:hypothetical protein
VQLHFVKDNDVNLRITAISATGGDWIEIHNPSDVALSARGWYLSDSSNLFRYRMPPLIIRGGETVRFRTRSNDTPESQVATLKRCQTNFNISFRETIRLTAADGNTAQAVDVTLLRRNQIQRLGRDGNWAVETENR